MSTFRTLVLSPTTASCRPIVDALSMQGLDPLVCAPDAILSIAPEAGQPDALLVCFPDDPAEGLAWIRRLLTSRPGQFAPLIWLHHSADPPCRLEGLRAGAADTLPFACDATTLTETLLSHRARVKAPRGANAAASSTAAAMVEAAPILMGFCDAHSGLFTYINSQGRRMAGISPDHDASDIDLHTMLKTPDGNGSISRFVDCARTFGRWEGIGLLIARSRTETQVIVTLTYHRSDASGPDGLTVTCRDNTRRILAEEALRESEAVLRGVMDTAEEAICVTDPEGREIWRNPSFCRLLGGSLTDSDRPFLSERVLDSDQPGFLKAMQLAHTEGRSGTIQFRATTPAGDTLHFEANICTVRDDSGRISRLISIARNVTERIKADTERTLSRMLLAEAQKLESIGRLAAGIAHEINTPTQFVGDNLRFLQSSFADLAAVVRAAGPLASAAANKEDLGEPLREFEQASATADLEYLESEVPTSLSQSIEGIQRVAKIVQAMKEFSHPGSTEKVPSDLNRAIETTSVVARNEWKYVADLVLDLDKEMGEVSCVVGEISQVVLNLIINASHAIADKLGPNSMEKGTITVSSRRRGDVVEIRVRDTGTGIPAHVQQHLFEPFFTTKKVGKGTGQGLALARTVIVEHHGGTLGIETAPGEGTCFIARIPTGQRSAAAA